MKNFEEKRTVESFSLEEFSKLADELLEFLSPRNRQVVRSFFGMEGKKQTLASIGKKMGITRERSRQIKVESLKKIKKALSNGTFSAEWTAFQTAIRQIILAEGGFVEENRLGGLLKKGISPKEIGQVAFLLTLAEKSFSFEKKNKFMHNFWLAKSIGSKEEKLLKKDELTAILEKIVDLFKKEGGPLKKTEVQKKLKELFPDLFLNEAHNRRTESLLFLGAKFKRNILNQWGFSYWPQIAASITKEKAFLVLKKTGKPLHFRQITDLIKEYWPGKKVNLQTVHNELIKDSRFALVGRGVYGLCQWGFVKSPVKKIIEDFLKKENRPLEKKEILDYIMKVKRVNKSTVSVCLSDKKVFQRNKDGKFALVK